LALKYRLGSVVEGGPALWDEVLAAEPEFFEVLAVRGERALAEKRLLSAEKDFQAAFERIPESPLLAIRLASLGFALEEFDRSLEYYEKTLAIAPTYKEAALGKAVALTCLGRAEEAAALLENLISRGPALKGECLYWLAWNRNEMGDFIRAAEAAEAAKPILERSQVYTLSGTINLARSLVEAAEADLLKAVDLNAEDCEAHFLLGKVYSQRRVWLDSGLHFRMAAYGYEQEERDLQSMAAQIEAAEMAAERKARLVLRKKLQVEKARLTRATACYNAAAGFHNAGEYAIARDMAERAAFHPYFQAKATEFAAFLAGKK
jgi:tetratricopeptide (TPR) repeat protein